MLLTHLQNGKIVCLELLQMPCVSARMLQLLGVRGWFLKHHAKIN
jgi:hypothetical protein